MILSDETLEMWPVIKINRRSLVRTISALDDLVTAAATGPAFPDTGCARCLACRSMSSPTTRM
jgi:hypothetical protein